MHLQGNELTDPIRQFNDYGFTMCSTISGIKCSEYNYLGYPCRLFDISNHTVGDVWYDGHFHHYDNSLSMYYTLPDGKTVASVEDVGKTGSGPETGGKEVPGYIALYHAVTGTSNNGFCEGSDDARPLEQVVHDFNPKGLKYRNYYYNSDRGHRYILNLRNNEVYTRFYSRQDINSQDAVAQDDKHTNYKADPAYFVPNQEMLKEGEDAKSLQPGNDPEVTNARYHIRGNGDRTWSPALDSANLAASASSIDNIEAGPKGIQPADLSKPGTAVFKVEGANVITGLKIHGLASLSSGGSAASIAVSTNAGHSWNDVWKASKAGENSIDLKLVKEVNASYEVLVKVTLLSAELSGVNFETITEINAHTQPMLKLGKNIVYVGDGEQTESIVLWPELHLDHYKEFVSDEKNIKTRPNNGWLGCLAPATFGEGYIVFKVDSPTDITSLNYGARMYNRDKSHIDYLHSFDGGKTWTKDFTYSDCKGPWDVIHYETVTNVPEGTRSVLFKYFMTPGTKPGKAEGTFFGQCSLYSCRMEVNHKLAVPADVAKQRVEVTFDWQERQKDYSTVKRSHTEVVHHLPCTYTINVGGYDQPIVDSLTVNLKGARQDVKLWLLRRQGCWRQQVGRPVGHLWQESCRRQALHPLRAFGDDIQSRRSGE